ncbi:hypothetical protein BGX26_008053 [Mortierella sp. AD094]|nr:hypothetical protein BGX26_008053 [Mortierella sp. AD094]
MGLFAEGGLCSASGRCVAIFDGPSILGSDPAETMESYPKTPNAVAYYPNLKADWAGQGISIPVSAVVAGVYCSVDRDCGVRNTSANISLKGAEVDVSDDTMSTYTDNTTKSLMIKNIPDRGSVTMGERTLSGNNVPAQSYMVVQRLFLSAEKDIRGMLHPPVFELNGPATWAVARFGTNNYLHNLWWQGGLMGSSESEAYSVEVDLKEPSGDNDASEMAVTVGLAAVRSNEFAYLELVQETAMDTSLVLSEDIGVEIGTTHGVPTFAHNQSLIKSPTAVQIESFEGLRDIDDVKQSEKNLLCHPLYVSLKTYFDNGGGPCYVCPTDKLVEELSKLDDVNLIVAAGENLIDQPALFADGQYFVVLDGPSTLGSDPIDTMKSYPVTPNAAVYYPNLKASWATYQDNDGNHSVSIPISAAVAGVYSEGDREHGVWKPPVNISLKGGVEAEVDVSDETTDIYTFSDKPLNVIKIFPDGGSVVWEMSTLGEDKTTVQCYVSVRRLFLSVEKDIREMLRSVAFQPNLQLTLQRVRSAINGYLYNIWTQGGLKGNNQSEAYSVEVDLIKLDGDTDGSVSIAIHISLAAMRPSEFIDLRIVQKTSQ